MNKKQIIDSILAADTFDMEAEGAKIITAHLCPHCATTVLNGKHECDNPPPEQPELRHYYQRRRDYLWRRYQWQEDNDRPNREHDYE